MIIIVIGFISRYLQFRKCCEESLLDEYKQSLIRYAFRRELKYAALLLSRMPALLYILHFIRMNLHYRIHLNA